MGCNNAKMVQVAPQTAPVESQKLPEITDKNNNNKSSSQTDIRAVSATSKISRRSDDSAFIEGDNESLTSENGTIRSRSGK